MSEENDVIAFKTTFSGPNGEKVLQILSQLCKENEPTYVDGNPYGSAYYEGKRAVMLYIRTQLNKK